jgi:hypothetical protein
MAWRIIRWDGWERGDGDAEYVKYDSVLYYCVVPLLSVPARLHLFSHAWVDWFGNGGRFGKRWVIC